MVQVVNKRTHKPTPNDIYIGRSQYGNSPLGNPYTSKPSKIAQEQVESRVVAIQLYQEWLLDKLVEREPNVIRALSAIGPDTNLVCWCAPAACHGHVIKRLVEQNELETRCPGWPCLGNGCNICKGTGRIVRGGIKWRP